MTIDEALLEIRKTELCWVVWSTETGEILSVSEMSARPEGTELFSRLQHLHQYQTPAKGRVLVSAKVSRQSLEQDRTDIGRVKARIGVLTLWYSLPCEDLIRILEVGEYAFPMARDNDTCVPVDHIWHLHRDELTQELQQRLHSLVGSAKLSERAAQNLKAYLRAVVGDEDNLIHLWNSKRQAFVLMECFSHTNTRNQVVISDLIDLVEKPSFMFEWRRRAMMTLGQLDAARQTRAADVIRKAVYDSTPRIVAARDHVLARLAGNPSDWMRCKECCHGSVHGSSGYAASCPACFGLGSVRTR